MPMPVLSWSVEVVRHLDGLVASHLPSPPIHPALREAILATTAEAAGCEWYAAAHRAWLEFVGGADRLDGTDEAVLDHARRSGLAGAPLPAGELVEWLPESAVRAVRATTARAGLMSQLGAPVDRLVARLTGRAAIDRGAVVDAGLAALALPVVAGAMVTGAALRTVTRLAPAVPPVELVDREPNLLAQVLAESVPRYLANAAGRLLVLSSPVPLSIGVRSGQSRATVTIDRGAITVANGIGDALIVLEGDVEPLLRVASATVARELRRSWTRPG